MSANQYFVSAANVREMVAAAGEDFGARRAALAHAEFCIEQGETQLGRLDAARAELTTQTALLDAENDASLAEVDTQGGVTTRAEEG